MAESFLESAQSLLFIRGAEVEEIASVLGDGRERSPRLALGLVDVGEADQAAEVGVAAEVACYQQHFGAIDLKGSPDQRLDPDLPACLQELHRSIDATPVGDRQRGHLQLGSAHGQLGRVRASVEEREVGVTVKLDVWIHEAQS
jgi:hypothetical protein